MLGLEASSAGGETDERFAQYLEPLIESLTPPAKDSKNGSVEEHPDTNPLFPLASLPVPVPIPAQIPDNLVQQVSPTRISLEADAQNLRMETVLQVQAEHIDLPLTLNARDGETNEVSTPDAKTGFLMESRLEGVPLPEGMEWLTDQSKTVHLNPQESATGVSEIPNPASPARQEVPLTPSLPSDVEQLLGTAQRSAPIEMAPQVEDHEPDLASPSEPQPRAELAGHPLWNHTVSAERIEVSNPVGGSQLDSIAVVEQVADHLERLVAQQERSRIQFRLDPPELGTVEIRIEVQGNSVQAWLMADQETTRHALNQHAQHLRDQLAERGLNLTQFEVGYGSSQSFAHQQARSAFVSTVPNQPISRPRMAMESLQRVAYNPNGQWSVWA